jgi:hypothetical protein
MQYTNIFHSKALQNRPKIGNFFIKIILDEYICTGLRLWPENNALQ